MPTQPAPPHGRQYRLAGDRRKGHGREGGRAHRKSWVSGRGSPEDQNHPQRIFHLFRPSKRPPENQGLDSGDGAAAERRPPARSCSPSLLVAAAHPPRAVGTFSLLATPIHPTYLCQLQTCPVFSPNKLASLRETLKVSPLLIPLISF